MQSTRVVPSMTPPRVVTELSPEVTAAFTDARIIALDVEGLDLSREGIFLPYHH
jgi:hypothetical protein